MGDKIESKKVAKDAGVHVIPGDFSIGWFGFQHH
jgi:biotin carboxylase